PRAAAAEQPSASVPAKAAGKVARATDPLSSAAPAEKPAPARPHTAPQAASEKAHAPLVVTVPQEPSQPKPAASRQKSAAQPRPQNIVWQLYCAPDGQLYYHTDKAYLERFVSERNALYANAQRALEMSSATTFGSTPAARTFFNSAPGFGYPAG